MYNKVVLVGNLTKDIELKYSSNGSLAISKSSLATSRVELHNWTKSDKEI